MGIQKLNVLIIDDLHPAFFEQDGMNKFEITYLPQIKSSDVAQALKNQDILVLRSKVQVNENLCLYANRLKLIIRAGSGVDNLDIPWLEKIGIEIMSTPEANAQAVAEHSLAILLNLLANIGKADREVRNRIWNRKLNRGDELEGKTIGIVGFGNTGSRFAKLLGGFGVRILAYDKYKTGFEQYGVKASDIDEIFSEADIVSVHVPLTLETTDLVNASYINQFSKPIRLLNLSRGGIVNLADVIDALSSHKIVGFGADVLPNENLNNLTDSELKEFDQLCAMENVVLTPHIGGWTKQSYHRISTSIAVKLTKFYEQGFEKRNTINA